MEDQVICIFTFKITPIIIRPLNSVTHPQKQPSKPNNLKKNQQSILFKLGTSQGKCPKIGQTVQIRTSVLYSQTLNKFCPIKGLIKIYDKNRDGSQMISCVGAFNTDQLLAHQQFQIQQDGKQEQNQLEICRNVGPCQIIMKIIVKRQRQNITQEKQIKRNKIDDCKIKNSGNIIKKEGDHKESQRNSKYQIKRNINCNINDEKVQQSQISHTQMTDNVKFNKQNNQMRIVMKEKDRKITTLERTIIKKNQEIQIIKKKLQKTQQDKKTLEGINQYLQQKDSHMQSIIAQKQTQIQSYKKAIKANNQQIDILQNKNIQQHRIIENLELTIDQTKQEIANLSQIIENYRRKYGDLKEVKDRALQRDLRQCLHWIDQYRTQELSEIGDQTTNNSANIMANNSNSNINVDSQSNNSMTSFMMKSIDQIEQMPLQQISHIRRQVVGVLKRLDEFLARNNF